MNEFIEVCEQLINGVAGFLLGCLILLIIIITIEVLDKLIS